jgi:hypothetical protein
MKERGKAGLITAKPGHEWGKSVEVKGAFPQNG